jgi:hypothetical protein
VKQAIAPNGRNGVTRGEEKLVNSPKFIEGGTNFDGDDKENRVN